MATEDEKTTIQTDGEDAAPPAKEKSKLLLFVAIGVICIGIGVGAAFMMRPSGSNEVTSEETADAEHEKKPQKEKKKAKKAAPGSGPVMYAIEDIVVNPAATGGSRFLSVSFGFELEDELLAEEFEKRQSLVRDALITILSSKTVAQLTDMRQKEIMRYQVKKRLEKLLDTEGVEAVYFTNFVLQ